MLEKLAGDKAKRWKPNYFCDRKTILNYVDEANLPANIGGKLIVEESVNNNVSLKEWSQECGLTEDELKKCRHNLKQLYI